MERSLEERTPLPIMIGDALLCLLSKFQCRLKALGMKSETWESYERRSYDNVVFCAPPSGSDDYPRTIRSTIEDWNRNGSCVFTSSTSVYPENAPITENTPTVELGTNERKDRLLSAEAPVFEVFRSFYGLKGRFVREGGWKCRKTCRIVSRHSRSS